MGQALVYPNKRTSEGDLVKDLSSPVDGEHFQKRVTEAASTIDTVAGQNDTEQNLLMVDRNSNEGTNGAQVPSRQNSILLDDENEADNDTDVENYQPTKESQNFTRLTRLVLDISNDAMRDILRVKIGSTSILLTRELLNSKTEFLRNAGRHINNEDKRKLFPNNGYVMYEELDYSLMYRIARNVPVCFNNIEPNRRLWGQEPDPSDKSLLGSIERLRCARNKYFAHIANSEIPTKDFDDLWSYVEEALKLAKSHVGRCFQKNYIHEAKKLKTKCVDIDAVKSAKKVSKLERDLDDYRQRILQFEKSQEKHGKQLQDDIAELLSSYGQTMQEALKELRGEETGSKDTRHDQLSVRDLPSTHCDNQGWTEIFLMPHLKSDKFFIKTRACKKVEEILEKFHRVTIIGRPGYGKTELAVHLLLEFHKRNMGIQVVDDINLISLNVKNQIVLIDNIFGNHPLTESKVSSCWEKLDKLQRIADTSLKTENPYNIFFIITSRKHVLEKAKSIIGCQNKFLKSESVVDISSEQWMLDDEEKKQILKKKLEQASDGGMQLPVITVKQYAEICRYDPPLGFPLCAQIFPHEPKYHTDKMILSFFTSPVEYIKKRIYSYIDEKEDHKEYHKTLFLLLMFSKGPIFLKNIDQCRSLFEKNKLNFSCGTPDLTGIEKVAEGLEETLVKSSCDGSYTFLHESIFEAMQVVFAESYFEAVIERLDIYKILNAVRIEETPVHGAIIVQEKNWHLLSKRLIAEILQGNIATVSNYCVLTHREFVDVFFKILKKKPAEDIFNVKDKETNEGFLYHTLKSGLGILFEKLLILLDSVSPQQLEIETRAREKRDEMHSNTDSDDTQANQITNRSHTRIDKKTLLSSALIGGCYNPDCLNLVEKLLRYKESNPSYCSSCQLMSKGDHLCALEVAAHVSNENVIRLLLENNAIIPHGKWKEWKGWEILKCAAKYKDEQLCSSYLLKDKSQHEEANLISSMIYTHERVYKYMDSLEYSKVFFSLVKHVQMTPKLVSVMKELNVDINSQNESGETYLHVIINTNSFEFILDTDTECLSSTYNIIDSANEDNTIPTTRIAQPKMLNISRKIKMQSIETLTKEGCDPNLKNNKGLTPLMEVLLKDEVDLETVSCLLQHGANPNDRDKFDRTSLHICIGSALSDEMCDSVVKELLLFGADISAASYTEQSPICLAVEMLPNRIRAFTTLVHSQKCIDKMNTDNPLHLCIENQGISEDVKIRALDVIRDYQNCWCVNQNGQTPLMLCVKHCPKMTKLLQLISNHISEIECNNDVDISDKDGNSVMHILASHVTEDNMQYILQALENIGQKKPNLNLKNKNDLTPVMIALQQNSDSIDVVKKMFEFGADINMRDGTGNDILHQVMAQSHRRSLTVVHRSASSNWQYSEGLDSEEDLKSLIFPLLSSAIADDLNESFSVQVMPLPSSKSNVAELVQFLLGNRNLDINQKDNKGGSYLHHCVKSVALTDEESAEVSQMLLDKGLHVDDKDENGKSVLDLAIEFSPTKFETIKLMFNNSKEKCSEAAKKLLNDLTQCGFLYPDLISFLHTKRYLSYDSSETENFFHVLAKCGYESVIPDADKKIFSLLKETCSINHTDHNKATPLHVACKNKWTSISCFRNFIVNGADVNISNQESESALHLIVMSERDDFKVKSIIRLMIENANSQTDLNSENRYKTTPLSQAILLNKEREQVIKILVEKGADVNVKNRDGDTALHLCLSSDKSDSKADKILEILLTSKNVDIKCENNRGLTPLHVAMSHTGHSRVACILRLLDHGDCNMRNVDISGRSMMYNLVDHLDGHECIVSLERLIRATLLVLHGGKALTTADDGRNARSICERKKLKRLQKLITINESNQDEMLQVLNESFVQVSDRYIPQVYPSVEYKSLKLNRNMILFIERCLSYLLNCNLTEKEDTVEERSSDVV